jgi:metal-dependent amidase/aminoacylase/carboxypeptidase family protein
VFDGILMWPSAGIPARLQHAIASGSSNANVQVLYKFKGVSAHAAGDPHLGRSALDAVELMNVGVQFLREHMVDAARIHYAIMDTGGYSPNVVQPKASVLYLIRSPRNSPGAGALRAGEQDRPGRCS